MIFSPHLMTQNGIPVSVFSLMGIDKSHAELCLVNRGMWKHVSTSFAKNTFTSCRRCVGALSSRGYQLSLCQNCGHLRRMDFLKRRLRKESTASEIFLHSDTNATFFCAPCSRRSSSAFFAFNELIELFKTPMPFVNFGSHNGRLIIHLT
ncbi:hypothetical protein TNCV_1996761 [Trichonephila clavipes]|uniref:Uncharacterized protein n=1 Tax=Trichonephila clavipes TaxID=2585209 RepID=A0A8X6V8G5_TRICX|nr:hypothetical protein TNCV_1996761 [Trichonephila clavipes]